MKLFRFFARHVGPHRGWLLAAALIVPLYALSNVLMIWMIEPIFGDVLLADRSASPLGMASDGPSDGSSFNLNALIDRGYDALKRAFDVTPANVVYFTPFLFVFIFVTKGLANFASSYCLQRVGLGITTDVRNALHSTMLRQSSRFHQQHRSSELISRVVNDVTVLQTAVTTRLIDLLLQSITLVALLALLLSKDWQLALGCLVVTPLIIYPIARFGRDMRRTSHRMQERLADVTGRISEGVRAHRVIQSFRGETYEEARFSESTARHMAISLRAQVLANLSSPVIEAIASVALAIFLIYCGLRIRGGEMSAPMVAAFLGNLMALYDPIRKLNRVNLTIQQAVAAVERVDRILDAGNEIRDRPGAAVISDIAQAVRFESVTFAYGDEPVLRDVDLTVPRGSLVALVGPSGAGKSSLVNLLPRLYDPDSGRVTIDGVDIRDVTVESLRERIGLVSQDTILFDDTVSANIAYADPAPDAARIEQAARAAFAADFVEDLPERYDTRIGEGGGALSGGQRQRLAIARALYKNAPILILDEATSHLDSESEALVQRALDNLMRDRTTLVIAHRLATVQQADRIVVMEAGRVTEEGTHAELLERGGTYRRLFDLQFRERRPA